MCFHRRLWLAGVALPPSTSDWAAYECCYGIESHGSHLATLPSFVRQPQGFADGPDLVDDALLDAASGGSRSDGGAGADAAEEPEEDSMQEAEGLSQSLTTGAGSSCDSGGDKGLNKQQQGAVSKVRKGSVCSQHGRLICAFAVPSNSLPLPLHMHTCTLNSNTYHDPKLIASVGQFHSAPQPASARSSGGFSGCAEEHEGQGALG
jgi:hypothetical protein